MILSKADMLLDSDFPEGFVRGVHPDDLRVLEAPVPAQCLMHRACTGHRRMFWRSCWQLHAGDRYPSR